ncbi:phospholipase D-like domain-containing protein [Alsobacter sp. KACC 23698]|uniref:Phospholipase D n=1 Tax=Alsobacter sp. KACC 23698 TaxID=3149229 RepID=A0AAU7JAC2_9HYPH
MTDAVRAFFTSDPLHHPREAILSLLAQAAELADAGRAVAVRIHLFSLTDPVLGEALIRLADRPGVTLRLLLDWCQGGPGSGRQAKRLRDHPSVQLRYQLDWPYQWRDGGLRWHYPSSLGLCHHKSLCLMVDGRAVALATGSYNWTARAAAGYENLLVLRPADADLAVVIWRHLEEFRAAWNEPGRSVDPATSSELFARGNELGADHERLQAAILAGQEQGRPPDEPLPEIRPDPPPIATGDIEVAFSGGPPSESFPRRGFAAANRGRAFALAKPSGRIKTAPLTLEALALEGFNRAKPGSTLRIAMFAMSRRAPEYSALLEAAGRGVGIRLILDRRSSKGLAGDVLDLTRRKALPIDMRIANRFMHQKYMILDAEKLVVTGTANFTPDSSRRHAESRLLLRNSPSVAQAFALDFERIWARLAPVENRDVESQDGGPKS